MARPFLFCCPNTGQNVQGSINAEPPTDGSHQYEAVECMACGRRHLVNVTTLKLLSEERED